MTRTLPRISTLDAYVLRRFGVIWCANLVSFSTLFVVIDAVSNIDDFLEHSDGLFGLVASMVLSYAALLPVIFCEILGTLVSVTAAMFTVTTLHRANEFVPILATGRSYQRTLLPIVCSSLIVSLGTFLVQELWIPHTGHWIRQAAVNRKGEDTIKNFPWVDLEHGNIVVFKDYRPSEESAEGVLVMPVLSAPGDELEFVRARKASWSSDSDLLLHDGVVQTYDRKGALVRHGGELFTKFTERRLPTDLTPVDVAADSAVSMSLGTLRRKADTSIDPSWRVKFISRFAYPLTNFILVLLGLPIIIHFGSRNIFVGALAAIAVCLGYFCFNSLFKELGVRGLLPARVGAVLGPVLFTALGATFYREMRS